MSKRTTHLLWPLLAMVLVSESMSAGLQASVTISGSAKDCLGPEKFGVEGVNVSAFKLSAALPIAAQLDTMKNFTGFATGDTTAFSKMNAMETKLQSLIVNTVPLARKITGPTGSFVFSIAPVDSLLVVGFASQEDDLYYYASKILSGQVSTSVLLDMSRGQCGF